MPRRMFLVFAQVYLSTRSIFKLVGSNRDYGYRLCLSFESIVTNRPQQMKIKETI